MTTERIGFTGTRSGLTRPQMRALTAYFRRREGAFEFHHGGCVGADEDAVLIVLDLPKATARLVCHPGPRSRYSSFVCNLSVHHGECRDPLPYLVRNRNIVNETELLIACPAGPEERRSGTWSTVRYAWRVGRPAVIVRPDGVVEGTGEPAE